MSDNQGIEKAYFAGGCFWCTEAIYNRLRGVIKVTPGYSGGPSTSSGRGPTYEEVSSGNTGHAEAIEVVFDPQQITFEDLLKVFFATHDPTTKDRQGNDVGPQYRSAIFYINEEQRKQAEDLIAKLQGEGVYPKPIVTALEPFRNFYLAEDYHQKYYEHHPGALYCQVVINPKINKLKDQFSSFLSETD